MRDAAYPTVVVVVSGGERDCCVMRGVWLRGVWLRGVWLREVWLRGVWLRGVWLRGVWLRGVWLRGVNERPFPDATSARLRGVEPERERTAVGGRVTFVLTCLLSVNAIRRTGGTEEAVRDRAGTVINSTSARLRGVDEARRLPDATSARLRGVDVARRCPDATSARLRGTERPCAATMRLGGDFGTSRVTPVFIRLKTPINQSVHFVGDPVGTCNISRGCIRFR